MSGGRGRGSVGCSESVGGFFVTLTPPQLCCHGKARGKARGGLGERALSLCFLDSAAGVGLSRSTARTYGGCVSSVAKSSLRGAVAYHLGGCSCALWSVLVLVLLIEIVELRFERFCRWKRLCAVVVGESMEVSELLGRVSGKA